MLGRAIPVSSYLPEVVLTSDGRQSKEINTQVSERDAVLRELYRSVVTKRELSNTANCLNRSSDPYLWSESWIMTEVVLPQIQVAQMGFLRRFHYCVGRIVKVQSS